VSSVHRVTVLVDDARWVWQGRRWAHLVSDESHEELHGFAAAIGKRRLAFQGDHYDVDATDRDRALARGAVAVPSRELVRRLRRAGLRDRRAKPAWRRIAEWPPGTGVDPLDRRFHVELERFAIDPVPVLVALFVDDRDRRCLLCDLPAAPRRNGGHRPGVHVSGPRVDGGHSVEIVLGRAGPTGAVGPSRRQR
jgi:hypothetical protein